MTEQLRTFSSGGGVQSIAALVLSAQGKIDFPIHLFSNVGDDSENPGTLVYLKDYALPYATKHGVSFYELRRTYRDGRQTTIYQELMGTNRTIPIPIYMEGGAPGRRQCTDRWKRRVIAKWQKQHGATPDNPAVCGLGISMDEAVRRMRLESGIPYQVLEYPLVDLNLTREDCYQIITEAGLPIPPKSSCWFCPFHRKSEWDDIHRDSPELYAKAIHLEQRINEKRASFGKDNVFLHSSRTPLDLIEFADTSNEDDSCDSGFCFT